MAGPIKALAVLVLLLGLAVPHTGRAADPITILGFGDSLMAGYGLGRASSFPAQLQAALTQRGHAVRLVNAGVSGDTSAGGKARLAWSLAENPDAVIIELGANDGLRGLAVEELRSNLDAMLGELDRRGIPTLLAGMRAPPNMGRDYGRAFRQVYADLARKYDVEFYPFFLDGVAANASLNQGDGIHPTAEGVGVIVEGILPTVEALIERVRAKRGG
ncbi:arylesterase [Thalassobaculum fulvum]|uniref:Arylesterase n=1 Tax=Thalassobaculum fulvum TaxID=1633335 RepID=A0A919CQK8_9PROT|nr:arylesterase [Thalassobaculum fulvum]GHD55441.1 arylesterase [Thalassobaculum fulvum]